MKAQYGKFLDLIQAVRINVPLVDVLVGMPNYGKFLKELVSNKHKLEQISFAFLNDESSAIIHNKVPPKLRDPISFLIPCTFGKTFSCNALANLGAGINLMPYSLYAKLSLETFKPTKMSVRLADRTIDVVDEILEGFDALLDEDSDKEEIHFEKITFDTDYKIKKSLDEPPTNLKLKLLPDHLEYAFLEEPFFLPVIISSQLSKQNENKLVSILKKHKQSFAWKTTDILSICPSFYKHKIQLLEDKRPVVQKQRRLNPNMQEVVKKKSLNSSIPELYIQSLIALGQMPFGLCNAPATFQRYMLAIFHVMIEEFVEVFMDEFLVIGNSFDNCLNNLNKMLQHCKDANLVLNWEKCHFMVKEGIVLRHKVSGASPEVHKAKIDVISKLPPPTNIKGIRSFLGHAGFYRRFIKYFSKIARPLTKLLEKDTPFEFNDECHKAFNSLKEKLTCTPVIMSPKWNLPFELMCDASEFAVGSVL
ncbi:reverse transcriptase domain-containing protein [Tanacetum coccineum]